MGKGKLSDVFDSDPEGPKEHKGRDKHKQVREGFRQCGVRVKIEGVYGNRTITLKECFKFDRHVRHTYTASNDPHPLPNDDRPTIMRVIDQVETIGIAVYVEGNRDYIRRGLAERFGARTCSVDKHPTRIGWNITRNK